MKRHYEILLAMIMMAIIVLTGCAPENIPVVDISISPETLYLEPGKESPISIFFFPENANLKGVIWSSSDESVATVSTHGLVKAAGAGECTITALSENGYDRAECKVYVSLPLKSIAIEKDEYEIEVNQSIKLSVSVDPAEASVKKLDWMSSDPEVLSVSDDGTVTANAAGEAEITVTAPNGSSDSCVIKSYEPFVFSSGTYYLYNKGDTVDLKPEGACDGIKWVSDSRTVLVDQNGVAKADSSYGSANIYAITPDDKVYSCQVKIVDLVAGGTKSVQAFVESTDYTNPSFVFAGTLTDADWEYILTNDKCADIDLHETENTLIPDNTTYVKRSNLKRIVLPAGLKKIGSAAFYYATKLTEVVFPEGLEDIGDYAFYYCAELPEVNLPSTLKTLGTYALAYCYDLESIAVPSGVKDIPDYCFTECRALRSVTLPEGLETIGSYAFNTCPLLDGVVIPANLKAIPNDCFLDCASLKDITLPEGLETIGEYAFYNTGVNLIDIPSTVSSIGNRAFSDCSELLRVNFKGDKLVAINYAAFANCPALSSIIIPEGVGSIGEYAFSQCYSLSDVKLPESLITISGKAFEYTDIRNIVIPAKVTGIEADAFAHVENLTSMTLMPSQVLDYPYDLDPAAGATLYVPADLLAAYNEEWSYFDNIEAVPEEPVV